MREPRNPAYVTWRVDFIERMRRAESPEKLGLLIVELEQKSAVAARADALAEIRAGVEGLDTVAYPRADFAWSGETVAVVSRAEVLALLDPAK